jgi:O-antigen ligase
MPQNNLERLASWIILFVGPAVAIFISPTVSMDPINQSKMLILAPCGFAILGLILTNLKIFYTSLSRVFQVLLLLFFIQLFLVLVFSGAPFNQQFYGVTGRNTGVITYISLIFIAAGSALVSNLSLIEKISMSLIAVGVLSALYGLLQTFGLDPINWSNPYNPIVGFFGNPNFQSSFYGITSIAAFSLVFKSKQKIYLRLFAVVFIVTSVFLILRSNSQQGLLVTGFGCLIVSFMYLIGSPTLARKYIVIPFIMLSAGASFIVLLGTLKIGPLADLLYKVSVRQRGFYWNSAIKMMQSHPIFGVGMDSFGDWYFKVRSAGAAFYTPNTMSNSAHNVFLELGAFGGFPLFILHFSLVLLTVWSIIKFLNRNRNFDWSYAAIVGAWIGYEAQAVISINQIGLAIWGWLLMGLLVGIEFKTRTKVEINSKSQNPINKEGSRFVRQVARKSSSSPSILAAILSATLALFFVIPVFNNDAQMRQANKSQNVEIFIQKATAKPLDSTRMVDSAIILAQNNLIPQAQQLVDLAIRNNSLLYGAWALKLKLYDPNSSEYSTVKEKLNELNPRVPIK